MFVLFLRFTVGPTLTVKHLIPFTLINLALKSVIPTTSFYLSELFLQLVVPAFILTYLTDNMRAIPDVELRNQLRDEMSMLGSLFNGRQAGTGRLALP